MTSIDDPAVLQVEDLAPHFDLFDPTHSERLWEVLSYARSACPVLKTDADEGYYIVTRYDDVRTVLEDTETYSSKQAGLRGALVKTGKFRPADLAGDVKPDVVLESVAELPYFYLTSK